MVTCSQCGASVLEGKKFCGSCGSPMGESNEPAQDVTVIDKPFSEAPSTAQPPPSTQIPPPPAQSSAYTSPPPSPQPTRTAPYTSQPQQPQQPPRYTQAPYYGSQSSQQTGGIDAQPPKGSPYSVASTLSYIGMMILFCIPLIGIISCIVMAVSTGNLNRRNFARAMLILIIIGVVFSVVIGIFFLMAWAHISSNFMQFINEATSVLPRT